jgi:hypothetical protein
MADNIIDILRFIDKDGNTYTANMDRLVFVHLKGDENIKGRKTFDESPLIPSYVEGDPETEAINAATLKKYINDLDNKAVSTSNRNQTVDGIKTFKNLKAEVTELQNSVVIKNTNPRYNANNSRETLTSEINMTDDSGLTSSGNLISQIKSTTDSVSSKVAIKASTINGKSSSVTVEVDKNGQSFATAPTVSDINDKSSKIVNTEFLRNYTLNLIYPVGAVFISTVATNPSKYLGGTWKQIEGKFLVAASGTDSDFYSGTNAGNKTYTPSGTVEGHVLTVDELAAHSHGRGTQNITGYFGGNTDDGGWWSGAFYCRNMNNISGANGTGDPSGFIGFDASRTWTGTSEIIGKNKAHSHEFKGTSQKILPPYLSVYMFTRTA